MDQQENMFVDTWINKIFKDLIVSNKHLTKMLLDRQFVYDTEIVQMDRVMINIAIARLIILTKCKNFTRSHCVHGNLPCVKYENRELALASIVTNINFLKSIIEIDKDVKVYTNLTKQETNICCSNESLFYNVSTSTSNSSLCIEV